MESQYYYTFKIYINKIFDSWIFFIFLFELLFLF